MQGNGIQTENTEQKLQPLVRNRKRRLHKSPVSVPSNPSVAESFHRSRGYIRLAVVADSMIAEEETRFTDADCQAVRDVLDAHDIRLAVLFGSATRSDTPADIDIAVEFESRHPEDDGYASTYLALHNALEDALETSVDLVDIHTADDRFLAVALETGTQLYGSNQRYAELKEAVSGAYHSAADAQKRVAGVAQRLCRQL